MVALSFIPLAAVCAAATLVRMTQETGIKPAMLAVEPRKKKKKKSPDRGRAGELLARELVWVCVHIQKPDAEDAQLPAHVVEHREAAKCRRNAEGSVAAAHGWHGEGRDRGRKVVRDAPQVDDRWEAGSKERAGLRLNRSKRQGIGRRTKGNGRGQDFEAGNEGEDRRGTRAAQWARIRRGDQQGIK